MSDAKNDKNDKNDKNEKTIIWIGLIIGLIIAVTQDSSLVGVLAVFGCCFGGLILYEIYKHLIKKKAEKPLKDFINENKIYMDFYSKCADHGIKTESDLSDKKNSEIIELILEQFFPGSKEEWSLYDKRKAAFLKGEAAVKKLDDDKQKEIREKEESELEIKKNKEREEYQETMKYDNLPGKQKLIAQLNGELSKARKDADGYDRLKSYLMNGGTQERERSSSIAGGIANGLAGPVAGMTRAMTVERENAQIRARNEENRRNSIRAGMSMGNNPYTASVNRYTNMLNEAAKKLVGKNPSSELFDLLVFDDVNYSLTECGSVKITGQVSMKDKVFITADMEGFIDGYVKAVVYEGQKRIGDGKIILPLYGAKTKQEFAGTVLFCADAKKKDAYRIEFEDLQLCAIES